MVCFFKSTVSAVVYWSLSVTISTTKVHALNIPTSFLVRRSAVVVVSSSSSSGATALSATATTGGGSHKDGSWSITDDWEALSSQHYENSDFDSSTLFNQDLAKNAALAMEAQNAAASASSPKVKLSDEDRWINDIVDEIHNPLLMANDDDNTIIPLYDTSFEESTTTTHYLDDMGAEIAMLVRCNQHPEQLLISEGRALPPLTQAEKDDVYQLIQLTKHHDNKKNKNKNNKNKHHYYTCQATDFLKDAVSKMFHRHAKPDPLDGVLAMGRPEVANWMTLALQEPYATSSHDRRVLKSISEYGSYGSGRLVNEDFQKLYLSVIIGNIHNLAKVSPKRHFQLRQPFIQSVWRDIRNHGIQSPSEQERERLLQKAAKDKQARHDANPFGYNPHPDLVMDECEILDWDYRPDEMEDLAKRQASGTKSSHTTVDMIPNSSSSNTKTPMTIRDGEFVFIDEESCIGCMQCVNVAPNSFLMLDNGRARTFKQRTCSDVREAVASCPVNCMHPVSYKELEEYETARDQGDGRTDHKHLGHKRGHTPLYVAGIDSDNNHRTSWYHTLKGKCLVSSECPQKGCYDCPKYGKPGNNPYFKERLRNDNHIRAQYFLERGELDHMRKSADL